MNFNAGPLTVTFNQNLLSVLATAIMHTLYILCAKMQIKSVNLYGL